MIDKIYFESKDCVVLYKPSGLASVPLKAKAGGTFLDEVASVFPEVLSVHGKNEWEGSAIHRLDTPTSGLMLFARNQEAYDFLLSEQSAGRIVKRYRATFCDKRKINDGFEPFPFGDITQKEAVVSSFFRAFGPGAKAVRPVLENKRFKSGRMYKTKIVPESKNSVLCTLSLGFRHQIRAHLAWAGHPLVGDILYGGDESTFFGLEAIGISFMERSGRRVDVLSLV